MVGIGVGLHRFGTLVAVRKRVAAVLERTPWLDGQSKSDIMDKAMSIARVGLMVKKKSIPYYVAYNLDDVMKAWNRAYKRTWVKTKRTNVMSKMKLQRDRLDPVVFYLVSSHQKPQPAHEPLQGKVLVDYFWRSTLDGDVRIPSVQRFIRKHKVRTVQWAMGAPHYLLVRPNCRHVLYPLKTDDVLKLSLKDIRDKYQPKRTGVHRPITDEQRWQDYKELRSAVLEETKRKTGA